MEEEWSLEAREPDLGNIASSQWAVLFKNIESCTVPPGAASTPPKAHEGGSDQSIKHSAVLHHSLHP